MPTASLLTGWRCPACGEARDRGSDVRACPCGALFEAGYDLERAGETWRRLSPLPDGEGMWRYDFLLPLLDPGCRVRLGEGGTPLVDLPRLGRELGIPELSCKDEGTNPTGSFKARGLSLAVSAARQAGAVEVAVATAGNAGGACAAYAAAAGIRAHVFAPWATSAVTVSEIRDCGAGLRLPDGDISDAQHELAAALVEHPHWRDLSVAVEPNRVEAKRTMAFELVEQCGDRRPDWIFLPTGGGVAVVAHAKAFNELEGMGVWEGPSPRIVAAQVEGCAPLARAFEAGRDETEVWQDPEKTLAEGVRVPLSGLHPRVLAAVRQTGGAVLAVSEEDLVGLMRRCARREGRLLSPEGAVAAAAAARLADEGVIRPDHRVVFYNTATAHKYPEAMEAAARET